MPLLSTQPMPLLHSAHGYAAPHAAHHAPHHTPHRTPHITRHIARRTTHAPRRTPHHRSRWTIAQTRRGRVDTRCVTALFRMHIHMTHDTGAPYPGRRHLRPNPTPTPNSTQAAATFGALLCVCGSVFDPTRAMIACDGPPLLSPFCRPPRHPHCRSRTQTHTRPSAGLVSLLTLTP